MRERIETYLDRWGRAVIRRRFLAIALCLAVAAGFASQLPSLGIETAAETFLKKDDPVRAEYEAFREQFGRQELIIVGVQSPDIFDLDFLRRLRSLHEELEEQVPHLDEIQSLISARSTRGSGDELIVEDLLEEFPVSPGELTQLRNRVISTPLYTNMLISEDATFTSLVVTLELYSSDDDPDDALSGFDDAPQEAGDLEVLNGQEIGAALSAVHQIMERYQADDFRLVVAGAPALTDAVTQSMIRDLQRFIALMVATIAVVLFAMFRRASGVILPLTIVLLSLLSTLGAMALSGIDMSPPTQVLPTFLLAVGTGSAVHILKIFYMRFDAGDSVEEALCFALRHSGLPVIMTSLTTAGGLLSFLAAGLNPIVHLGMFAPLGVLLALAYCLVLLPALLAVAPIRRKALRTESTGSPLERLVVSAGDFSVTHPRSMVVATVLLIAISLTGAVRLEFGQDIMAWLVPDHPLRRATELIDHRLKGSITMELIADTGRTDGVKQPQFLNGLEELRKRTEILVRGDYLFVGKTISIADILKEIHQALNENRADFYAIPQSQPLIAQELLLFENTGTDDLEDVVDTEFRLARFTLKVPYTDPTRYGGFIEEVESEFRNIFGDEIGVTTTGFMPMMGETMAHVVRGMARSYVLAIFIVTPLMVLLIGNFRGGLVSMVPNITPILITLGLMGWFGVTVDMFTMMIGGIAIGLVVDDTIHFIHGFQRDFARTGDARVAVRETLQTTGRALLVTSLVLASGFLVFTLSTMQNLFYFGLFTSFTIVSAFLIDILITPALMVLVTRKA